MMQPTRIGNCPNCGNPPSEHGFHTGHAECPLTAEDCRRAIAVASAMLWSRQR